MHGSEMIPSESASRWTYAVICNTHTHAMHKVSTESSSLHNTAKSWEVYFTARYKYTHKHTHTYKSLHVTKLRYFVHILSSSFFLCGFCILVLFTRFLLFILILSTALTSGCKTLASASILYIQTNHKVNQLVLWILVIICYTFIFLLFRQTSENVVTNVLLKLIFEK